MSELKILLPQPEVVMLGRRRVRVRAVQLRQFELFGRMAGGLVGLFKEFSEERVHAFSQNSKALNQVLADSTDLGWWARRRLSAPAAIELLGHVVRVNNGFFAKALLSLESELAGLK